MRRKSRLSAVPILAVVLAAALTAAACGASGDSEEGQEDESSRSTTTEATGEPGAYGDLTDVCGPGDYSVADGVPGQSGDELHIGVAVDRTSSIRPGLNKEMWDAALAFTGWCNDQGGLGGLTLVPVELEGALFEVESAMTRACTEVFAMVGGGFAQDNLEFSGKEASDFHLCGMVDVPGFAVSPEKSDSNGQVQPLPNPGTSVSNTWIRDYAELEPQDSRKVAIAYGELPALEMTKDKYLAALDDVGLDVVGTFPYPPTGMTDWTPLAQRVIDSGATTLMWVGEPGFLANMLSKLGEQNWEGTPLLETNMYDPLLFSLGDQVPEGAVIRMAIHPVEEADRWPAVQQYLDTLDEHVDGHKTGMLGMQGTSAWLLFAVAANACAAENDGVLERNCILEQAAAIDEWTGGGMHGPTDPSPHDDTQAAGCDMLVVVRDGGFHRLYPELGGEGDDVDGFHCPADGVTEVPALEGRGKVDPDRPI